MTDSVLILGELAYWQETGIRVGAGLAAVLLVAGTLVYLHLFKLVSFMQSRLGPMEAGPFGSLQLSPRSASSSRRRTSSRARPTASCSRRRRSWC